MDKHHEKLAQSLQARVLFDLPIINALGVRIEDFDGRRLRLTLPLEQNRNDKNTAFAGSIASAGALTGWSLLTLAVAERMGESDIAIYQCQIDYSRPVTTDFCGQAELPQAEFDALLERLRDKGRGKINLSISVSDETGEAASLTAAYAVRIKEST